MKMVYTYRLSENRSAGTVRYSIEVDGEVIISGERVGTPNEVKRYLNRVVTRMNGAEKYHGRLDNSKKQRAG